VSRCFSCPLYSTCRSSTASSISFFVLSCSCAADANDVGAAVVWPISC
jgi:hypothetical protein